MNSLFKTIHIIGVLFLTLTGVNAQQVIASTGGIGQNTSGTLTYTIGELAINSKTGGNITLTEGFHQSTIRITAINNLHKNNIKVVVYPNPTEDKVAITTEDCKPGKYSYSLYDNNGKRLLNGNIENNKSEISFGAYAPGQYILKILCTGKETEAIKIIKQ